MYDKLLDWLMYKLIVRRSGYYPSMCLSYGGIYIDADGKISLLLCNKDRWHWDQHEYRVEKTDESFALTEKTIEIGVYEPDGSSDTNNVLPNQRPGIVD